MSKNFVAETLSSARKLRYAGRGRGKLSPVHPAIEDLCVLVENLGRNRAQKLIKACETQASILADIVPPREYDEWYGFVGIRNNLIYRFARASTVEVDEFDWSVENILYFLGCDRELVEETLDNQDAPKPWHVWMSSLGRSRSSVRPWRQKGVNNKDADDSAWFLDAEVVIANLAATRESGELSGHTTLRVVRYTDFGQNWEILHEEKYYMWSDYGEKPVSTKLPMTDYGQAWVDWIGRKTDVMPRV
jgi:hypothetical protein